MFYIHVFSHCVFVTQVFHIYAHTRVHTVFHAVHILVGAGSANFRFGFVFVFFFCRKYLLILFSCTGLYKTLNHSGRSFAFQSRFHDFFKKMRACSFKEQG